YVQEVRKLAAERSLLLMEMYDQTLAQCERLTPAGCATLNATTADGMPDTTHLSAKGQTEVGAIAAREFLRAVLPAQSSVDPKTVVANTLLPATQARTTFAMPEPANPDLPSLFIVGDSTVRNGRGVGAGGLWGWGEPLSALFDTSKINVVNRAIG